MDHPSDPSLTPADDGSGSQASPQDKWRAHVAALRGVDQPILGPPHHLYLDSATKDYRLRSSDTKIPNNIAILATDIDTYKTEYYRHASGFDLPFLYTEADKDRERLKAARPAPTKQDSKPWEQPPSVRTRNTWETAPTYFIPKGNHETRKAGAALSILPRSGTVVHSSNPLAPPPETDISNASTQPNPWPIAIDTPRCRLPREVLVMIFEELANTPYLRGMRLVSSQFEDLIVPIVYRHVTLTSHLLDAYLPSMPGSYSWEKAQASKVSVLYLQMALYTRHVTIDRKLDLHSVCKVVKDLGVLESVKWSYWDPDDMFAGPSFMIQHLLSKHAKAAHPPFAPRILVEDLDAASIHTTSLKIVPPQHLTSFKTVNWQAPYHSDIKDLLLGRPELETIHLVGEKQRIVQDCVTFPDWAIQSREKLPPVKKLVLQNYFWGHSPHTAVNFWNWTQITHLELKDASINRFLKTVPPKHLEQLKTLVLLDHSERSVTEVTKRMSSLVYKILALEKLTLKCKVRRIVTTILKQGPSLRSLALREYFGRDSRDFRTLIVADVEAIQASCPKLMELALDVHFKSGTGPADAIHISDTVFSNMRNLRRLSLFTRVESFVVPSVDDGNPFAHRDMVVRGWLQLFLLAKKGANFERILIDMRVGKAMSHAYAHVIWTYEDGKGLGEPVVGKD